MAYHPHSEMSEQGLLGSLIVNCEGYELVEGRIEAEDFYIPLHSRIFKAIQNLKAQNLKVWPGSVFDAIKDGTDDEYLKDYCTKLFEISGMGADIGSCTQIVLNMSHKRKLMSLAKQLTDAAERQDENTCVKLQEAISELQSGFMTILPDDPLKQIESAFRAATHPEPMMPTGIGCWDEMFGGISKGVRYVVAGRGGAGKTALSLNIAWNISKQGKKVRYIFFEGTVEEVWWRIMSRELNIPITSFRKGLTEYQQTRLMNKQEQFTGYDFAVVRNPKDVGEMIGRCGKCDLIVLDGITSAPRKADTLIEGVMEVMRYCKTLADKTGAAVIMLAHLNSEGVKNGGTGTGIFGGQAATFDPESIIELRADEDTKGMTTRRIDGLITKNRYGSLGQVSFGFTGEYMTYGDWN